MEYRTETMPLLQNQAESPQTARELKDRIRARSAKVGVVGLGYVGLPLAAEMAHAGFQVTGIDLVKDKVDSVNSGISYVLDIASEALSEAFAQLIARGAAVHDPASWVWRSAFRIARGEMQRRGRDEPACKLQPISRL